MGCEEGKKFGLVGIADRYIQTTLDEDGVLDSISYIHDENFNFAYDVVDVMAKKCPDKLAMLHVSQTPFSVLVFPACPAQDRGGGDTCHQSSHEKRF